MKRSCVVGHHRRLLSNDVVARSVRGTCDGITHIHMIAVDRVAKVVDTDMPQQRRTSRNPGTLAKCSRKVPSKAPETDLSHGKQKRILKHAKSGVLPRVGWWA